jgi:hypothetical protein
MMTMTAALLASQLSGVWENTETGTSVKFVSINGSDHAQVREDYRNREGQIAYTITQSVRVPHSQSSVRKGEVDFYDSRGCSYKKLPVTFEFSNDYEVNVLMTVPRYKVTNQTTYTNEYRTRYCRSRHGSYYVCGRYRIPKDIKFTCELIEHVEVPVTLLKIN